MVGSEGSDSERTSDLLPPLISSFCLRPTCQDRNLPDLLDVAGSVVMLSGRRDDAGCHLAYAPKEWHPASPFSQGFVKNAPNFPISNSLSPPHSGFPHAQV